MAQRRMFSKDITASDLFVDMPASTQLLYFQLGMEADDEGFIGNAKMLSRAYGANNDDLKLLHAKGFIIMFESGVTVVKDWKINNQIRKDRFKPTIYQAEKSLLSVDFKGSYHLGNQLATKWQPNDNQLGDTLATQYSIGKDSIGKDSIGKDSIGKDSIEYPAKTENLNFGQFIKAEGLKVNDRQMTRLLEYIGLDGMDMELVKEAVRRTTDSGIDNPNYTFKILDSWKAKGILTIEQANKEKEEFQNHKQQRSQSNQQQQAKSNVPDWVNEEYKHEATEEEKRELEKLLEGMED